MAHPIGAPLLFRLVAAWPSPPVPEDVWHKHESCIVSLCMTLQPAAWAPGYADAQRSSQRTAMRGARPHRDSDVFCACDGGVKALGSARGAAAPLLSSSRALSETIDVDADADSGSTAGSGHQHAHGHGVVAIVGSGSGGGVSSTSGGGPSMLSLFGGGVQVAMRGGHPSSTNGAVANRAGGGGGSSGALTLGPDDGRGAQSGHFTAVPAVPMVDESNADELTFEDDFGGGGGGVSSISTAHPTSAPATAKKAERWPGAPVPAAIAASAALKRPRGVDNDDSHRSTVDGGSGSGPQKRSREPGPLSAHSSAVNNAADGGRCGGAALTNGNGGLTAPVSGGGIGGAASASAWGAPSPFLPSPAFDKNIAR